MIRVSHIFTVGALMLLVLVVGGTVFTTGLPGARAVDEPRSESRSVEPNGAESVVTRLDMSAGTLKVSGGADGIVDANFLYEDPNRKPEVGYTVDGGVGELSIHQDSDKGVSGLFGRGDEWDVRLNDDIPTDLSVNVGAGTSYLDLRGMSLTRLDVRMGAGSATVDLSGSRDRNLETNLEGGMGELTLRLPENIGVRVVAEDSIGPVNAEGLRIEGDTYTNDANGESEVTLEVNIASGIGQINLETAE